MVELGKMTKLVDDQIILLARIEQQNAPIETQVAAPRTTPPSRLLIANRDRTKLVAIDRVELRNFLPNERRSGRFVAQVIGHVSNYTLALDCSQPFAVL